MTDYRSLGKAIMAAPAVAPTVLASAMRRLLDIAIDGQAKLPGAKTHAAHQFEQQGSAEKAIDALVAQHITMAGAQGFLTNIGGAITLMATLPANIAGLALVQARMVAAIAHLRGYDVDDSRVRTAIAMCLLGEERTAQMVSNGDLPTTPLGVATAPVADPKLERIVDEKVTSRVLSAVGGKRLAVFVVKRIPVLGGGIGAVTDSWSTFEIARFARATFVSRRREHRPESNDDESAASS